MNSTVASPSSPNTASGTRLSTIVADADDAEHRVVVLDDGDRGGGVRQAGHRWVSTVERPS
ncbi:hypothetical protein [Amycolatopsis arida]|uniref:hypothetical protein n=1 Tax=Amycolatopsis arida TaxID=587909 RepID=UPI000B835DBF|nr:hypothetical protein [Amycolatopsis arida]